MISTTNGRAARFESESGISRWAWSACAALLLLLASTVPVDAWATATGNSAAFQKPFMTVVQSILDLFNSGLARMLAILAVIGLGLAAMAGKLSWVMATRVVVGIVLVFGASSIVGLITGNGSNPKYQSGTVEVPVVAAAGTAVGTTGPATV